MATYRKRKDATHQMLPNATAAWGFIRCCFDIRDKDLNGLSQKTLRRFTEQREISPKLSRVVNEEIERCLWDKRLPISGKNGSPVNGATRKIVERSLAAYLRVQEGLEFSADQKEAAQLLVIKEVVVPTVAEAVADLVGDFDDLIWHRPWMIGDEFRGEYFWYLPGLENGKATTPLQRILDYWLRAAKLNAGYGLGKHLKKQDFESPKRQVERWQNGEAKPSLTTLHTYVDQVKKVDWLGGIADWKARFTLAWAMQTAGEELDRAFTKKVRTPALSFAEVYRKSAHYALKYESYGPVSFVARLLEQKLRDSNAFTEWRFVRKLRTQLSARWKPPPPLEQVLEALAVRQWLLTQARDKGVLSRECLSPLFPLAQEQPIEKQAQQFWDLVLPLSKALPKKRFDEFCEFATKIGVRLIKKRLTSSNGRRATIRRPPRRITPP